MTPAEPRHAELAAWSRRLRESDRGAFTSLFHALYPDLLWYASRIAGPEAADDLVQDAFVCLWERRAHLDPDQSARPLLYVTVRNRALNAVRNASTRAALRAAASQASPPSCPDDDAHAGDLAERMRTWINELPARQREAFELSRHCGLSHREVAAVMQLSVLTVETHVTRALRHLRRRLRAFDPDLLRP